MPALPTARALHEEDSRRRERALLLHPILLPAAVAADWNRRVALEPGVGVLSHAGALR